MGFEFCSSLPLVFSDAGDYCKLGKCIVANARSKGMAVEEDVSESLVKIHKQGSFTHEMNLRLCELLPGKLACRVKDHNCPCDDPQHGTINDDFLGSNVFPQNAKNPYHCSDEQTVELLQGFLNRMDLKEDKARMCALEPNTLTPYANKNLELGKVNVDLSPRKTFHMPQGGSVHSNVKGAVVKVTNKPLQATLSHKLNEQKSVQSERCLLFKGQQLDFFEALKKKLKQKDLENQQIVRLLLIKHQELRDVKEILKLKEVEAQLMGEKLKCEEKNNSEFAKRFNTVFEDMREKFSVAKSNKESYAKQLKALLEKYERLKRCANTVKLQLREERTKKKSSQKTVIKIEQMAEELLANQNFLEKQRDALASELAMCRKKIQTMKEEHKKHVGTVQRVGEERSAIRVQYENLREELCKTQEDNKKLRKAVQTKDLERARAVESLEQSENVVKQLQAELKESKTQRESIHQQLETMKKEINLIHKRHIEERLQLQEQHKTSMKQLDNIKIECDTLNEIVSNLKKDKNILKQELECLQKEKAKYETASKLEGERLRKTLCLLERERELLLDEMEDLRKDYFSLSDRITQRLGQLDQDDAPMFITDISSFNSAPIVDNTVPSITTSVDMIQHLRRKLDEEENIQKK